MPAPHGFPQQRGRVGDHEPRRFHRVLGPEVLAVFHLARQADDQGQRLLGRPGVLGPQRRLRAGGPAAGTSPASGSAPSVTPAGPRRCRHRPAPARRTRALHTAPDPGSRAVLRPACGGPAQPGRVRPRSAPASTPSPASTGSTALCAAGPHPAAPAGRRSPPGLIRFAAMPQHATDCRAHPVAMTWNPPRPAIAPRRKEKENRTQRLNAGHSSAFPGWPSATAAERSIRCPGTPACLPFDKPIRAAARTRLSWSACKAGSRHPCRRSGA